MRIIRTAPLAALTCLFALLLQTGAVSAGTTGGVSGDVVAAQGGAPVAGAKVTASSPAQLVTATTDGKGHFAILSLPPGRYTVTVSAPGYVDSQLTDLEIDADQTISIPTTQLTKPG